MEIVERYDGEMGQNPARVNLDTKVCELNAPVFYALTPLQQKLVLAHEEGHLALNSVVDEIGADKYALEKYVGSEPYSLRKMVDALITFFEQCPGISDNRKRALIISALEIDAERYGNEHAQELLSEIKGDDRVANMAPAVIAAIISAAVALITMIRQTMFNVRARWFQGDLNGKKQTVDKEHMIDGAMEEYCNRLIAEHATGDTADGGELTIHEKLQSDEALLNNVHANLFNYFKDYNVCTPAFHKSSKKFYSSCKWAKEYVLSKRETCSNYVRKQYYAHNFTTDPRKKGGMASGGNLSRYLLLGIVAVVVLMLIKKRK